MLRHYVDAAEIAGHVEGAWRSSTPHRRGWFEETTVVRFLLDDGRLVEQEHRTGREDRSAPYVIAEGDDAADRVMEMRPQDWDDVEHPQVLEGRRYTL